MSDRATLDELHRRRDANLMNRLTPLHGDAPAPPECHDYQKAGIERLLHGVTSAREASGILHYPTGAGKTRVAMEFMARSLRTDPQHRFVWATNGKALIRQTMVRLVELSKAFPVGTRFAWLDAQGVREKGGAAHVTFLTRHALAQALDETRDGRRTVHPWARQLLLDRAPLTLVYDECHQLGALGLQDSLRKFYDAGLGLCRWRVVGLSATPVPTADQPRRLLEREVFPLREESAGRGREWKMHVIHAVTNRKLEEEEFICPVRAATGGEFEIDRRVLEDVIGHAHLPPPGQTATAADAQRYALQFNQRVMSASQVTRPLADAIAKHLPRLGKTIVFAATIAGAMALERRLREVLPGLGDRITLVYSTMPGDAHGVLESFQQRGDQPSVLVNVNMLTEGFDDPKVQTVVLARLTFSANRFWQMIGRGRRGPRAGGTKECIVIDPIRLTRIYPHLEEYQPNLRRDEPEIGTENEDGADEEDDER